MQSPGDTTCLEDVQCNYLISVAMYRLTLLNRISMMMEIQFLSGRSIISYKSFIVIFNHNVVGKEFINNIHK